MAIVGWVERSVPHQGVSGAVAGGDPTAVSDGLRDAPPSYDDRKGTLADR